jgi:hypothetical protein
MKKYLMLAMTLAFMSMSAFAIDVGGGLMLGIGSRTVYEDYEVYYTSSFNEKRVPSTDFGLHLFLGWKYFDFTFGFPYMGAYKVSTFQSGFNFKIPITVSSSLRFYPMIGSNFAFGENFSFMAAGIHGGVGADFLLFGNMFLRGNILYAYGFELMTSSVGNDQTRGHGGGVLIKAGVGWKF